MGIFWNYADPPQQHVEQLFTQALAGPPLQGDALLQQAHLHASAAAAPLAQATLNRQNFGVALLLVLAFVGAGVGTNAAGLTDSTTALFSLATTAFGVVVGLLTGEKPSK